MFRQYTIGLFLLIGVPLIALFLFGLAWLNGARGADQIPCWKAQALLMAVAGNEARAEKIARKHGYSKAQIAEVRQRCGI